MSVLLASIVDAAVVLSLALAATFLMARRAAAARHAVLAIGIITALAMPVLELLLPQFPVITLGRSAAMLSSATSTFGAATVTSTTLDASSSASRFWTSWIDLFLLLWTAGAVLLSAGLATGLVKLARLRRRCTPIVAGRWRELADAIRVECGIRRPVRLLQSDGLPLLVTCGVWSPAIVLPAAAMQWRDGRKRIVLRHELAHIQRHDAAIQLLGEVLRIVQWPNPLVWLACRCLRQQSEYACDDAVLRDGVEGTEYASELLEVARHMTGRDFGWTAAPAVAHRSTLERRIVAMLHRDGNHGPLSRRGWVLAALVAFAVSIPVAGAGVGSVNNAGDGTAQAPDVIPHAGAPAVLPLITNTSVSKPRVANARPSASLRQAPATLAGTIVDQSGGVMPGVEVTITDEKSGSQRAMETDATGRFTFRDIAAGDYGISATLPGFAKFQTVLTLQPGATVQQTITLALGSLFETVTVTCPTSASADLSRLANTSQTPAEGLLARSTRIVRAGVAGIGRELVTVVSAQEQVPIKVGGNVRPPRKIYDLKPVCPPGLRAGNTVVKVTGRVDTEGLVQALEVAQAGAENPIDAVNAALDAVRRWKFAPTLLNGQPVEVFITVQVTFVQQ